MSEPPTPKRRKQQRPLFAILNDMQERFEQQQEKQQEQEKDQEQQQEQINATNEEAKDQHEEEKRQNLQQHDTGDNTTKDSKNPRNVNTGDSGSVNSRKSLSHERRSRSCNKTSSGGTTDVKENFEFSPPENNSQSTDTSPRDAKISPRSFPRHKLRPVSLGTYFFITCTLLMTADDSSPRTAELTAIPENEEDAGKRGKSSVRRTLKGKVK